MPFEPRPDAELSLLGHLVVKDTLLREQPMRRVWRLVPEDAVPQARPEVPEVAGHVASVR